MAGGKELGWNVDSAVVCWRRFLGLLGDFSHLSSPAVMVDVFTYLDSLTDSLLAIDAYQPLELMPNGTVKAPTNRPPIDYLVPVYLKVRYSLFAKEISIKSLEKAAVDYFPLLFHRFCKCPPNLLKARNWLLAF